MKGQQGSLQQMLSQATDQVKLLEPKQKLSLKTGIQASFDKRGKDLLKEKAAAYDQMNQSSPSQSQSQTPPMPGPGLPMA